jgi:hypothetical protein
VLLVALALASPASAAGPGFTNDDYFTFADRIVSQLEPTWSQADGYYKTNAPQLESRYNAALLLIHATAAFYGHVGASRNDDRARALASRLTQSPPFYTGSTAPWPDPMFHSPGWLGNLVGGYGVMDKAIDPKIAEGLQMAWRARDILGLPPATTQAIVDEIGRAAATPFFRYPRVRLNQFNWPLELDGYDAEVSGQPDLLRTQYSLQVRRFAAGIRRPWLKPLHRTATNLSPSYRFHYAPDAPSDSAINLDSAEYANVVLHFLAFYGEARTAGMPALPRADVRLLRAWVQRDLFGYWTHAGFLNWDTGLGFRRWMKGNMWAYAQQGLLAIASAPEFQRDPRYGPWAKTLFDRGLQLYARMDSPGEGPHGLPQLNLFDIGQRIPRPSGDRIFAARMAANAARAVAAGLGRIPGVEPPPFYAFDADVGRLAVSTPSYATAVLAVNRGAFPYGGIELARLFDGQGDPVGGIGGRPPAAFGVVVKNRAGRVVLASQKGLRRDPARPPIRLTRSPQGPVTKLMRYPARPAAGPFRVVEAVGHRRSRYFDITTRHRFTARAIVEDWVLRRRRGRQFYSAAILFPSWGQHASVDAELVNGTVVPLAIGARTTSRIALSSVRRFRLRSEDGSYTVTPLAVRRGRARAIAVAQQRSAPDPGPTLELTLGQGSKFKRAALEVRITPDPSG